MGRQTFDRIKKAVSVLLAVLFVVSLSASAVSACADATDATTPTTEDKTLDASDLGALIASILNNMGYKLDLGSSGDSSVPSNYLSDITV